jgi:hypothetical protein
MLDIKNIEHYNDTLDTSLVNVCMKIVGIMNYYILYANETSFTDPGFTEKGVDIILNVFAMILLYTKNIELTVEYTNNSIYYFIEYINQISNNNADFVFVNLTLKDAVLYVYRKSIFEIDSDRRKVYVPRPDEHVFFDLVNQFITMYSVILHEFVSNDNYSGLDVDSLKAYLYKINAYIMTLFNTIETYTDVGDTDHRDLSEEDRHVLYSVTYDGFIHMRDNLSKESTEPIDNKFTPTSCVSYDSMCEKIKIMVFDHSDSLMNDL